MSSLFIFLLKHRFELMKQSASRLLLLLFAFCILCAIVVAGIFLNAHYKLFHHPKF